MKTKTISISTGDVLCVEVPREAFEPWINPIITDSLHWVLNEGDDVGTFKIPKGDWTLLGVTSAITEEMAMEIMPKTETGHFYAGKYIEWDLFINYLLDEYSFETSLESFHSLLQANNIHDTEETKHVILFKKK